MIRIDRKRILTLITVAVISIAVLILGFLGIYRCPMEFLTGIPCPACGFTRACVSVLNGDFGAAFYYHPLWPLVPVAGVLYILYYLHILKISDRSFNAICIMLAAMLLVCYIIRMITGSPIVRPHFDDSVLYHMNDRF